MHKILYLSIGVTLFVIIIGCAFLEFGNSTSKENNKYTNDIKIEDNIQYKGKFPIPVANFQVVTSAFGNREGGGVVSSNHKGIDLVGEKNSNIICVKVGTVTWAGWQNGYGNCVEIKHKDENGNIFYTFYAHMQDNSLKVKENQEVIEGQIIGIQGTTGNSTGDHLHFEIRLANKVQIDPAPYLFEEMEKEE